MHGRILNTVATDALVLKHQAISIHTAADYSLGFIWQQANGKEDHMMVCVSLGIQTYPSILLCSILGNFSQPRLHAKQVFLCQCSYRISGVDWSVGPGRLGWGRGKHWEMYWPCSIPCYGCDHTNPPSRLILGLCPANEIWRYIVTTSLIGWAQA